MKKLSLVDYGKLELRDDWEGIALQPGMVKVRVSACAICGSDIALFRGKRDLKEERYFGHEFAGVVVDAAPGADSIPMGTRVASEVSRSCGKCWNCRHGLASYCKSMNEAFLPGGFARETGAYVYYFDLDAPGDRNAAFHSSDLRYVFGTLDGSWRPYGARDREASAQLTAYLANFARSGDPNGPGLPVWRPCGKHRGRVLRIAPRTTAMGYVNFGKLALHMLTKGEPKA